MNKFEQNIQGAGLKFDALIVLGHNLGSGWKGERIRRNQNHLSGHSKLSVQATGILYRAGIVDRIIFSSGHTAGKKTPSEAEAMKTFLLVRFPEIPINAIILEDKSIETSGNIEESKRIVDQENFINVGLMSTGDHVLNASVLSERYGLKIKEENCLASEEIVAKKMAENPAKNPEAFLRGYRNSLQAKGDRQKEKIRSFLLQSIDRKGRILRFIAWLTRR
ncbi:MAG: hypothetical protein HW400_145 [Candidatus Levybacteria bacterium]|nr:hypothetical protein [Candidatus Levybacteria bacterium]